MKKILMLATGGTIASKDSGQGLTPAITSQEILSYVPAIGQLCQVEAIQLMNLDSTNITPRHWQEMARAVEEHYDQYDGFVITHGTDTMAYTAAAPVSYTHLDVYKRQVMATRADMLSSAKREAEAIRKAAEDKARQMVSEDVITLQAKQRANEMMQQAEERSRELKRSANEYCEDALRRTEEAVAEAYDEIKKSRARFRAAAGAAAAASSGSSRPVYDAAADVD